eukprot:CFRG5853T1
MGLAQSPGRPKGSADNRSGQAADQSIPSSTSESTTAPAQPREVREISQTDHLNKKLLTSLMTNFNPIMIGNSENGATDNGSGEF